MKSFFINQTVAKKFEAHLHHGALPRGRLFSIFRDDHVEEVRTIFDVFLNAKSFDDFMAMAAWSSLVINEMSWMHAFFMALAHRPDAKYLRLPNVYEIFPHYFFNTDVIMQSYRVKSGEVAGNFLILLFQILNVICLFYTWHRISNFDKLIKDFFNTTSAMCFFTSTLQTLNAEKQLETNKKINNRYSSLW